jgi:iron complex outermembrane receptor protein
MNHKYHMSALKNIPQFSQMLAALFFGLAANVWANEGDRVALESLSLNDLMQIEVSSVSRKSQTLSNTAAAAFVISQEDIHRSGATSIPAALRLAPGLEVAQIGTHKWAITARGFNDTYANKLLVLIDGRTVYTPLFSGVFWDLQDTMMEDIERIEVIRGPGAAMWGANAVNGVINIITKKAKDTRSDLLVAGAGNQERGYAGFRHGGSFGDDGSFRVYGKGLARDASVNAAGQTQDDAVRSGQLGFRIDRNISNDDRLTLQGDAYQKSSGNPFRSNAVLAPPYTSYTQHDDSVLGGNLLARWESTLSNGSEISLQGYYDRAQFSALAVSSAVDTYDIDFQHRLHQNATHDLMWGGNYRHIYSVSGNTTDITFTPANIGYQNVSVFAQDDIALTPERLRLTLGAKAEKSYFGGMQLQPNARLLWTPNSTNTVWFAVSRASRTPSQGEEQSTLSLGVIPPSASPFNQLNPSTYPTQMTISGNPNLAAEKMTAYEAGYRTEWSVHLSSDIAAFSNHYSNLIQRGFVNPYPYVDPVPVFVPVPHLTLPLAFTNATTTTMVNGLELSAEWRPLDWMRLNGMLTYLKMQAPPWDGVDVDAARLIPRTHESLQCRMDLNEKTKLDFTVRHVGNIPSPTQGVPAYTAVDARLGYTPHKGLEFSLVGKNLFEARHTEFSQSSSVPPSQIPRSIYAMITWNR